MNYEMKTLKIETIYKDAYIDRYRRLGYEVFESKEETEDGLSYTIIDFRRDKDAPSFPRLFELENEVERLCEQARASSNEPDFQKKHRKICLWIIFGIGIAFMAAGMAIVVSGLLTVNLFLALGGWGCAIAGAVLVIVWSCLREKWRLRKIDIYDDAMHPGFGIDKYSKQVEECLKLADEERSGALSH